MINKPELLAPAGSLEKLKTALTFGADAVYFGIPDFSLRVRINTFTLAKIKQGIKYARDNNKKVYLTLNIFAHNKHLNKLPKYIAFIKEAKPDAIIVSDPGIINIIKTKLPKIEIHLSTQANCTNWQAAKFWHEAGVKRIILGREVTLKEIAEIHKKVPQVELEYFVHGAMCMSYSGRCMLSKWLMNRSANLGDCVQPCRWNYHVVEEKRPNTFIPIEEDRHGTYIFNSKDLCLLDHLEKLKKAGIMSFKIEGRAKSIYYLANIIKIYRQAIDKTKTLKHLNSELAKLMNRGYTTGFLYGEDKEIQNTDRSHFEPKWEFVGEVLKYNTKTKQVTVKVHNSIKTNNQLEFVLPCGENFKFKIKDFYNTKNKQKLTAAHGGGGGKTIYFEVPKEVPIMTVIRKKL